MATIMKLFSRYTSSDADAGMEEARARQLARTGRDAPLHAQDVAAFERLGESQQAIDFTLAHVVQGLTSLQALTEQMSVLKASLARSFEEHRKLALANSAIKQDRDHAEQRYFEKSAQYDETHSELVALRAEAEDLRRNFERTRTDLDTLEHKHQLLGVAKKEVEEQLTRTAAQLVGAQEEIESQGLEVSSLQEMVDSYGVRIGELTAKYNDANNKTVLLTNRCEALEGSLQQKVDEVLGLTEQYDLVSQEKESAVLYSQQKEQEAVHARSEMARMFQQGQQEKKARELEISQLKAELDSARAHVKTLDVSVEDTSAENERLNTQLRRLEDQNKQYEVSVGRLESKVARLNARQESAASAKAQLEQSRATISARLEAVTQALCERDSDVKRLEAEVSRLAAQVEQQSAMSQDSIEAYSAKVFELEKELSGQRNQTAFYVSQLEAVQRPDLREITA